MNTRSGPLAHIQVLDLSRILAAPWAGQILELKGDHAWEAKVGALDAGGRIEWKGKASDGAVVVRLTVEPAGTALARNCFK